MNGSVKCNTDLLELAPFVAAELRKGGNLQCLNVDNATLYDRAEDAGDKSCSCAAGHLSSLLHKLHDHA